MTSNDQPEQPKPGTEKKSPYPDWYVPPELGCFFMLPSQIVILILSSYIVFPLINELKSGDAVRLYSAGLGCGVIGIVLLFFARLPLYRQRRFWTVGPRELDRFHRKLYKLAYVFVVLSILLLLVVWARVK